MITPVTTYNSNYKYMPVQHPSHKGGIKSLNAINPIMHYTNDYFVKMAKASTLKFQPIKPTLENVIKHVKIKSGKYELNAWDMNPNNSDKYILFLHGMAQNITDYQDLYESIINQGDFGVLALEYRAYGENTKGKPSEDNLIKDARSGFRFLTNTGIKPENIILAGHSMGGSLATTLATKQKNIKGLLLICPLTKTEYWGKKFLNNSQLGMGVPYFVQNLTEKITPLKWLHNLTFNSIDKLKDIKCPIYLIHSRNDTVTSLQGARNFVKAAKKNNLDIEYHYPSTGGHKVDSRKIDYITDFLNRLK